MSYIEAINNPAPLPLEPLPNDQPEDRRLWIGNLDSRITEYQLIKLLQKHGTIEKFDLLFHRNGPLAGQPRGYAFVTYASTDNANKAMDALDGQILGTKRIAVRLAHSVSKEELEKPKPKISIPALAGAKEEKKASPMSKIQAIEAKLRMMEKTSDGDDFDLSVASSSRNSSAGPLVVPGVVLHSYRQPAPKRDKPYSRSQRHKHRR